MFKKLKEIFDRAQYRVLEDNFLIMPSREVLEALEKKGWKFKQKEKVAVSRYGGPTLLNTVDLISPQEKKLKVGEHPELWAQYKADRSKVLYKIYKEPYLDQKPN
jgi:hypothetical protein